MATPIDSHEDNDQPDIFKRSRRLDSESDQQHVSLIRMKSDFMKLAPLNSISTDKNLQITEQSIYFGKSKEGFLLKRGGQDGNKPFLERWVSFRNNNLTYSENQDSPPIRTIPLSRIKDVEVIANTKKPKFHVITPDRTYIFMSVNQLLDEVILWASFLAEAILFKNKNELVKDDIGGKMANPNKEGWLLHQGNNRYVAIKYERFCCYNNFDSFRYDLPTKEIHMVTANLKVDAEKFKLTITTSEKIFNFKAKDQREFYSWKAAIEYSIQYGLGDDKFLKEIQMNPSNKICADCGLNDPIYASINLMVVVCSQCIGWHRNMGVNISKTKSILMDVDIWSPSLVKLLQKIGNNKANDLWNHSLPSDEAIGPYVSPEGRKTFIYNKYFYKKYMKKLFDTETSGMVLRENVITDNILKTFHLLISSADVYHIPPNEGEVDEEQKTPFELAESSNKELQMELLKLYSGHILPEEKDESEKDLKFEMVLETKKCGLLQFKTSTDKKWKEKYFNLDGKKLNYKGSSIKAQSDTTRLCIDMREVEFLGYKKGLIFINTQKKRSYILTASSKDQTILWYQALRRQQAFGVPIEFQDCGVEGIPYVIEKCLAFIEQYGLTEEGIYRISGNLTDVGKLIISFNQDAENADMSKINYPEVSVVATTLKRFLRELPSPIITYEIYTDLIQNSMEADIAKRKMQYKDLLKKLPKRNYESLKAIIIHLYLIVRFSEINKMTEKNVKLLFGPMLLSGGRTLEFSELCNEYIVFEDLLTNYDELFDINDIQKRQIEGKIGTVKQVYISQSKKMEDEATDIQITVFIIDDSNEDQMKMDNSTSCVDVSNYFIEKYLLKPHETWILFEVLQEKNELVLERPIHVKECIKKLVCTHRSRDRLMIKQNYIGKMTNGLDQLLTTHGLMSYSQTLEKWKKKCHVQVKTGNIKVNKNGQCIDDIPIHHAQIYVCNEFENKKKSLLPARFCFVLKLSNQQLRYFCCDDESVFNMFIAALQNVKYPLGLWNTIEKPDLNEIAKRRLSSTSATVPVRCLC